MIVTNVEQASRTFTEAVAGALDAKENLLVELDSSGKIQAATAGKAFGVMIGKLQNGSTAVNVHILGKGGTVKMIQKAAITPGTQVVQDPANPTKVITFAQATNMKCLGRKVWPATTGADGDIIEVADVVETVLTKQTVAAATNAGSTAILALAVGSTYSQSEVQALRAQIAALSVDVADNRTKLIASGLTVSA